MTLQDIKKKYKGRKMVYEGDLSYRTESGEIEWANFSKFKILGSKRGYEIDNEWLYEEDQGERVLIAFKIEGIWDKID